MKLTDYQAERMADRAIDLYCIGAEIYRERSCWDEAEMNAELARLSRRGRRIENHPDVEAHWDRVHAQFCQGETCPCKQR